MISVGCTCGWKATAPSRRQADAAIDEHRRLHCTLERTCAICAEIGPGAVRSLDEDGPAVFVCRRCDGEHPRGGGYGFDDSGASSRVTSGRTPSR